MTGDARQTIELEGRLFIKGYKPSLKNHLWCMNEVRQAGLDSFDIPAGESPDETAQRIVGLALASGKTLTIIGGMLLPDGMEPKAWTPEVAAGVTAHLEGLSETSDMQLMQSLISGLLIGFFQNRTASLWTSRKSSPSADPALAAGVPGSSTAGSTTDGPAAGA
jgi:hypothetical protein